MDHPLDSEHDVRHPGQADCGRFDHVPKSHTVKELWEAFTSIKTGIKEATVKTYDDTHRRFFQFFDPSDELSELTADQMKQWKEFLRTKAPRARTKKTGLAESTVAGTISKAKAVFNWAVNAGWLEKSPLDGVGRGSFVNKENDRFITMDEYRRLLDACPCLDWRIIITLARIGGLRCPSELLRLRWTDINWERNRFYVTSSKTDRYAGKEGRLVPLFPELRQELERLFFDQAEGTEFVVNRYRRPKQNLGTQFARIVKMAGIEEIKRPFDNMRASRSNEIYAAFGAFYESVWIGHSSKVARDHYLQVREEDYARAVSDWTNPPAVALSQQGQFPCCENGFSLLKSLL